MDNQISTDDYSVKAIDLSPEGLKSLSELLIKAFAEPKLTKEYLYWLYKLNPAGEVIGYNAFFKNRLVSHYALIPVNANYKGRKIKALHSVNTATNSEHQGKGLFSLLAKKTYKAGKTLKFEIVFGVANTNSIHGFINKLDFNHIAQLDTIVSFSFPKVNSERSCTNIFSLPMSEELLSWKVQNPNNDYCIINTGDSEIYCNEFNKFSRSIMAVYPKDNKKNKLFISKINIWVGISQTYSWNKKSPFNVSIPEFLKPSPLHLVYKNLSSNIKLSRENIHFEAINFDAF